MDITEAYTLYAAPIRNYIYRKVDNYELADDLVQDTFERALRAWAGVRGETAQAWLYRVAHNLIVSYLRRDSLVAWASLDTAETHSGQDEIELCIEREHIELILSRLSPNYARALRLCLEGGNLSYAVLAKQAGVSTQNFKMHVSRARKQFAVLAAQQEKGA